jgi:hypothetical protein
MYQLSPVGDANNWATFLICIFQILAYKLSFVNLEFGLRHFSSPKGVEGEWVVAGGGRKPSGAGGEFFQRGLEWRRELCKIISRF